jgi:hypothetical protein
MSFIFVSDAQPIPHRIDRTLVLQIQTERLSQKAIALTAGGERRRV